MHQLWPALENSDVCPYVLMPMPDLFLPVQDFSPLLCRYLLTVQRVTGKLLSSMPARMPSSLCEVLKQPERFEKLYWLLCKIWVQWVKWRGVRTWNTFNFPTECQCLLHGHPWENLQRTARDLGPPQIFATRSLMQALGRWIFSLSPRQAVKQVTEANVFLWTQIPSSESTCCW